MKSILDPSFRYTKSADTDLKRTFARIRRERRKEQQAAEQTLQAKGKILVIRKAVVAS